MLGYIYTITNKINGKLYIGKTFNYQHRKETHLSDLRNNKHHSIELQRAYNKYGENNFNWAYEIVEINDENELSQLEIEAIDKANSFYNGYNETYGGDGHKLVFDLQTSILLYLILLRYNGVNRQIANYYHCDHTVIDLLKKNILYKNYPYSELAVLDLIIKLQLSDTNLIENYIPHNNRKLNTELCLELLSIITQYEGYDKTMCEIFNITSKLTDRLKKGLIYLDCLTIYNKLSNEEKLLLAESTLTKYNVENIRALRLRRGVAEPLTQDLINYILDNYKLNKKLVDIAKELNISASRVSDVVHHKSYKDLIKNYENLHSST